MPRGIRGIWPTGVTAQRRKCTSVHACVSVGVAPVSRRPTAIPIACRRARSRWGRTSVAAVATRRHSDRARASVAGSAGSCDATAGRILKTACCANCAGWHTRWSLCLLPRLPARLSRPAACLKFERVAFVKGCTLPCESTMYSPRGNCKHCETTMYCTSQEDTVSFMVQERVLL